MAYKEFDDKFDKSTGDAIQVTEHEESAQGVQDEFEERLDAQFGVGVISGFAVTTSDANSIAIAAGDAYAGGKRYSGAGSVDFSASDAANDYTVFVDSSDDTTPYDKTSSTLAHDSEDLALALVTWDGGTNLSALVDRRRWGVVATQIACFDPATVVTGTLWFGVVERDMWIEDVHIVQTDNGSAGTTIVDVHAGSAGAAISTIFTTQTRRPELVHSTTDRTVGTSGEPETTTRKLSAGDILEIIVDTAATGAKDLSVVIRARYY